MIDIMEKIEFTAGILLQGPPNTFFFLEYALKKKYWIFSQISFFIWMYNPSG